MNSNGLTVISMLHNRQDERVENLLWSLTNQVVPSRIFIGIVDTSENYSPEIHRVCRDYAAAYEHFPQREFNKPWALNIGIKNCYTEYIMCCDIDMFFSNGFIETVMQRLDPNRLILATCAYLNPALKLYRQYSPYELKLMIDPDRIAHRFSPGAVQIASREWFHKVHGYDEKFVGLGGMDDDLIARARMDGLEINWIEFNEAPLFHQWHEVSKMKGQSSHLFQSEKTVVRNLDGWGEYE